MVKGLKYAIFIALIFTSYLGVAESIFSNPITGTNPNMANPYTAGQTHDPHITVSGIKRSSDINGVNTNNRYNASGWPLLFCETPYFEFTLTPNPCYGIDFHNFEFTIQSSLIFPGLVGLIYLT